MLQKWTSYSWTNCSKSSISCQLPKKSFSQKLLQVIQIFYFFFSIWQEKEGKGNNEEGDEYEQPDSHVQWVDQGKEFVCLLGVGCHKHHGIYIKCQCSVHHLGPK